MTERTQGMKVRIIEVNGSVTRGKRVESVNMFDIWTMTLSVISTFIPLLYHGRTKGSYNIRQAHPVLYLYVETTFYFYHYYLHTVIPIVSCIPFE